MIVHLGIDLCCANDLGVCSGGQRQTFNKWTHNVCHDSSESVFNTDCNGMRHFSKTNGVCERWTFIITSLHWCATCRLLLQQYWKVKCPTIWNQNKRHGNDPPQSDGSRVSYDYTSRQCLPQVIWYLQRIQKRNLNAWIRKKSKIAIQMVDI